MRLSLCFRLIALVGFIFGSAALTWGGTIRVDKADSAYRNLASAYASVGKLNWTDGGSSYLASGTLIAPNWVLTAGHCTDGTAVSRMSFALNQNTYTAAEWIPHPLWSGNLTAGFDIGLVRLASGVTDVAPATRLTTANELGKVGTSVGFGTTGTGQSGYKNGTGGTKRAGENVIDAYGTSVGMSHQYMLSDFDDPSNKDRMNAFGSNSPLGLEYSIAPGDSGGGTFIDVGGTPVLAGVHSFISAFYRPKGDGKVNASYSDFFGSTRVSLFNDWINSYVLDSTSSDILSSTSSSSLSGNTRRADSGAVPEPASGLLAAMGLLFVRLGRYRGRRGT